MIFATIGDNLYKQVKDIANAIKFSEMATKMAPSNREYRNQLATLYFLAKNYDRALGEAKRNLKNHFLDAEAYNIIGGVYFRKGNLIVAKQKFIKALELDPELKEAQINYSKVEQKLKQ